MSTLLEHAERMERNVQLLKPKLEVLPQFKTLRARLAGRSDCRTLLREIRQDANVLLQELSQTGMK